MRQDRMLAYVFPAALVLSSAVWPAHAAMTLVSRDTELSASALCAPGDTTCTPSPGGPFLVGHSNDSYTGFGAYSNSVSYTQNAYASQQSSISSTHISVQTLESAAGGSGTASSSFTLKFSLDAPEQFTLTDVMNDIYTGNTQLAQLTGPSGIIFSDSLGGVGGNFGPPATGVLASGLYTFLVQSTAESQGGSSYGQANADLRLTPVPLPAALWLLASAVGMLGFSRRA